MTEKPIFFNTDMVRAILEDRKNQTRRVAKQESPPEGYNPELSKPVKCPYQVGDILWVRETWCKDENGDYVYRANYGSTEDDSFPPSTFKWRPSIHMPRAAARIFLKVNNIRAERLQEITRDDAIAEGCGVECTCCHKSMCANCYGTGWDIFPEIDFQRVWDSIYEKRGHGWEANPWVFVVGFEVNDRELL